MITVEWTNPQQTAVLWKFAHPWTWAEFYAAQKDVDAMIDTVSGLVDSIFLTTSQQRIPKDAITHFRNVAKQQHERSNRIVVVGAQSLLSTLVNVVLKLMPGLRIQLHFVKSIDEAYAFLAKESEAALRQKAG